MASAFPQVRVETKVSYPALRAAWSGTVGGVGLMKELVRHESPGSMPFIDWDGKGWRLEDGRLIVCVSSAEGAAYLRRAASTAV